MQFMPSETKLLEALYDIRNNVVTACEFVEGLNVDEFKQSRSHMLAAVSAEIETLETSSASVPIRD